MLVKPRTFFAIHKFETKSYEDSAGKLEVREPMVQSELLGEHQTFHFGWQQEDSNELIKQAVIRCKYKIGTNPIILYGAGAHTTQYWDYISILNVVAIVDKNAQLWGKMLNSLPIISPDKIETYGTNILISSRAFEDNIHSELSTMNPKYTIFKLYGNEFLSQALKKWCNELKSQILAFKPDLLVHTPTHVKENISKKFFLDLKKRLPDLKILTVWWDYDEENEASGYLEYEREVLDYADLVIENSNGSRLKKLKAKLYPYEDHRNVEKVIFQPTWFDPSLFYCGIESEKSIQVALFGSVVGERREWINFLQEQFYEQFIHIGGVSGSERNLIAIDEYAKLLRKTNIVVNTQTYGFREQCKGKVREAIQCGAILIEQDNSETREFERLYGPFGIRYFSSKDDLVVQIRKAIKEPFKKRNVDSVTFCKNWTKSILLQL